MLIIIDLFYIHLLSWQNNLDVFVPVSADYVLFSSFSIKWQKIIARIPLEVHIKNLTIA